MANVTSTQVILDGPRNCIVKFEGVLDTSDLASAVVVDPALLSGVDNTGTLKAGKFRIESLFHNIEDGLDVALFWDATVPVRIESLTGRDTPCYKKFGGLTSNAGAGATGKITATVGGWSGVKSFLVILKLIKTA